MTSRLTKLGREDYGIPESNITLEDDMSVSILDSIVAFRINRLPKHYRFDPRHGRQQDHIYDVLYSIYTKRNRPDERSKLKSKIAKCLDSLLKQGVIYRVWYRYSETKGKQITYPYLHTDVYRLMRTDYFKKSKFKDSPYLADCFGSEFKHSHRKESLDRKFRHIVLWAQEEFNICNAIGVREIAWRILQEGLVDSVEEAKETAEIILSCITPPLFDDASGISMERYALVIAAYEAMQKKYDIEKIYVSCKIPNVPSEHKIKGLPFVDITLPRPDIFISCSEGWLWVNCLNGAKDDFAEVDKIVEDAEKFKHSYDKMYIVINKHTNKGFKQKIMERVEGLDRRVKHSMEVLEIAL